MNFKLYAKIFGLISTITLLASCNGDEDSKINFDRKAMLQFYGNELIIPAYEQFNSQAIALNLAVNSFSQNPDFEHLDSVRSTFKSSYIGWQRVSNLAFGPAADRSIRASLNTYPADTTALRQYAETASWNPAVVELDEQGFPALDFLLFGNEDSIAALFLISGDHAQNYRRTLTAVSAAIMQLSSAVLFDWNAAGGNYISTFESAEGTDIGSSAGLIVNAFIQHTERFIRDAKIGIPLGKRSLEVPLPGHIEAPYAGDLSVELAAEAVTAIRDLYIGKSIDGTEADGFEAYLEETGAMHNGQLLSEVIRNQFEVCIAAIATMPVNLAQASANQNTEMQNAFDELQRLLVYLKTDMVSRLGIQISYQDNDGD